jgi:exodeoxyribonuclease-3
MMKLASWNVNSLKVRLDHVLAWMDSSKVDVLALQETKVVDEQFPVEAFTSRGLSVVFSGQKTYNGTAVVSRLPMNDILMDIPSMDDPQRRILAVTVGDLRLINLYVPNGAEVGSDKYQYKLAWLNSVNSFIKEQLLLYPKLAVVGDFNIAPEDKDVHSPEEWHGCVLVSEPERKAFADLIDLGLNDSFRSLHPDTQAYSWWDYRAAGFRRNRGLRIDHILLSAPLLLACTEVGVDVEPRRSERPSDHAPVYALLNLQ